MMRSYLGLSLSFCLMFAVGCGDDGGTGGTGGTGATGGAGGVGGGTGGAGGAGGAGGIQNSGVQTDDITLGCRNSVTATLSFLPGTLTVDSDAISGGADFGTTLSGVVSFPESFLDVAQSVIPGGLRTAQLIDAKLIVQARSGATETAGAGGAGGIPGVALPPNLDMLVPGAINLCSIAPSDQTVCDLANNQCNNAAGDGSADPCSTDDDCPAVDETCGNTDCPPFFEGNFCDPDPTIVVDLPISDDCTVGGACDMIGKLEDGAAPSQCTLNGFCVTGALDIALGPVMQTYTADASGNVLFGWADQGLTNNTLDTGTGIYTITMPQIANPIEQGLKVLAGTLTVAIECVMAVDVNEDESAAGVTPDADLIPYSIQ